MKESIKKLKKISKRKISEMGKQLLSGKLSFKEKEFIIMTLAHSPTKEALSILKTYHQIIIGLKYFTQFALEECEWWNE